MLSLSTKKEVDNVIADALSRIPAASPITVGERHGSADDTMLFDSNNDCFFMYPSFDEQYCHPFYSTTIKHYQQQDQQLMNKLNNNLNYYTHLIGGTDNVCTGDSSVSDTDWQIALPDIMAPKLIKYYHEKLGHVEGVAKLVKTTQKHFYHPRIQQMAKELIKNCPTCKRLKTTNIAYGQLSTRNQLQLTPWQEVHVDLIGP